MSMRTTQRDLRTRSGAPDADLLLAARGGNLQARETLFRRHVRAVYATAFRLAGRFADPRPLVEESFRRLFASLEHLVHPDMLRPFVAGVVTRVTHEAIQRPQFRARFRLPFRSETGFDVALTAGLPVAAAERLRAFYDVVDRLPLRTRAALVLRHLEGMSSADIALALGTSVKDVVRSLARGERRLGPALPRGLS